MVLSSENNIENYNILKTKKMQVRIKHMNRLNNMQVIREENHEGMGDRDYLK